MNKTNFIQASGRFPMKPSTMNFIQEMIELNHKLAKIGGIDYILEGCEINADGTVNAGYIVVAGEVLPFVASDTVKTYVEIVETRETVNAFGTNYPDAYVTRYAQLSAVATNIEFASYKQVISNSELLNKIQAIKGEPIGVTQGWVGYLDKIQSNYMLCDGRSLKIEEYPELYEVIGTNFGAVGVTEFKLPDSRGRFIVNYNEHHDDYDEIGNKGGHELVTLTIDELPEHEIEGKTDSVPDHSHLFAGDDQIATYQGAKVTAFSYDAQSSGSGSGGIYETKPSGGHSGISFTSDKIGNNEAHENRPPFFVRAEIIKVKY